MNTIVDKRVDKLAALRAAMAKHGIDAWIIPSSDAHESEYVAEHWEGRSWVSGFTGSAGTLVVTSKEAALWTDGRYFIQAEQELADSTITLMKDGQADVPAIEEWLTKELPEKGVLGFDGNAFSLQKARGLMKKLKKKQITLKTDKDLLDDIWSNRPELPAKPVFLHDESYAGKSLEDKLLEVRKAMAEKGADHLLVTTLDDIAWLFNLRGSDIECNPVFLAYALFSEEKVTLFINEQRIEADALAALKKASVELQPYEAVTEQLANIPATACLLMDPVTTSQKLASALPDGADVIEGASPSRALKAIKNETEITRMRDCHRRDGAAIVRFMRWLGDNIPTGNLDEVNIDEKLCGLRAESESFKGVSFPSIVGYGPHAAICHYRADEESKLDVKTKGLLLVDSGGQYPDGTTDITRTFACGDMTEEERHDYTMVMKSHIALAMARFKKGTRGIQLDAITRQPMWAEGIDFNHGTGHGVGYFLNVHEGPQSISSRWIDQPLEPGMLITNEPGIYRDGKHGVRLENIMLVTKDTTTGFGEFYRLEALTRAPFDTRPLVKELMTAAEINWLNNYHGKVRNELSGELEGGDKEFLVKMTEAI